MGTITYISKVNSSERLGPAARGIAATSSFGFVYVLRETLKADFAKADFDLAGRDLDLPGRNHNFGLALRRSD